MWGFTLNNLLAAAKSPPLVVVGVGNISSQSRQRDLNASEPFRSRCRDCELILPTPTTTSGGLLAAARRLFRVKPHIWKPPSEAGSEKRRVGEKCRTPGWAGQ